MKMFITDKMIATRNELLVKVSNMTGVAVDDIMSKSRKENISNARMLVMWSLCALCGYSHTQTAILMRRNHSTITYAMNHIGYYGKEVEKMRQSIIKWHENKGECI